MATETKNYVFTLTDNDFFTLKQLLSDANWELQDAPYMHYKAKKGKTSVCAYQSGKLVAQGKEASDFVEFILEPLVLKEKAFENQNPTEPQEPFAPHAGMDESGKGNFFGPLVVAAVYVRDEETAAKLLKLGVRDSKMIKNDKTILETAKGIRQIVGDEMGLVTIGPEAYNRLYNTFGNLNRLLAWGHARALENLLNNVPECPAALADKFADEHLILNALKEKGSRIALQQRTKAESDIAVAAASIMARAQFVRIMQKLSEENGLTLPKGASTQVDEAAAQLFQKGGTELLTKVAKMHFRTAYKAQGLPLPEKTIWKH